MFRQVGIVLILIISSISPLYAQAQVDTGTVIVLADEVMAMPLAELARDYSKERGATINLTFGDSAAQEKYISDGAACDLLISGLPASIARLRAQGLTDIYSQRPLARDSLAFIGGKSSTLPTGGLKERGKFAEDLILKNHDDLKIFLPSALWPEGLAASDALGRMELLLPLSPYIKTLDDRSGVVAASAKKGSYAFISYSLAIAASQKGAMTILDVVPPEYHRALRYEGVVVGGENMTASRKFLDYLTTKQAKAVFKKYGFSD